MVSDNHTTVLYQLDSCKFYEVFIRKTCAFWVDSISFHFIHLLKMSPDEQEDRIKKELF